MQEALERMETFLKCLQIQTHIPDCESSATFDGLWLDRSFFIGLDSHPICGLIFSQSGPKRARLAPYKFGLWNMPY